MEPLIVFKSRFYDVIQKREQLIEIAKQNDLKTFELYGSTLSKTDTLYSDIDLLAVYPDDVLNNRHELTNKHNLQEELSKLFNCRVGILSSLSIPEVFYPQIENDPVDIRLLDETASYTITPKSSLLYYKMLDRDIGRYNELKHFYKKNNSYPSYKIENISWWISRLLRLQDNDIRTTDYFNYIEIISICYELTETISNNEENLAASLEQQLEGLSKWVNENLQYTNQ
jgi:predicted nucleotidyltransferase